MLHSPPAPSKLLWEIISMQILSWWTGFGSSNQQVHKQNIVILFRYETKEMMCMFCQKVQPIQQNCAHCHKILAKYYCPICKFLDDDPKKDIFHCSDCGLCRVGKRDQFFHCAKCQHCLNISLKDSHQCIENNTKQNCPICHSDLFTSRIPVTFMKCGHSIHTTCFKDYTARNYNCPICQRSVADMYLYFWPSY